MNLVHREVNVSPLQIFASCVSRGWLSGSPKSQEMVSLSNTMTLSPPIFIKNLDGHEQFNVSNFGNYIKMTF